MTTQPQNTGGGGNHSGGYYVTKSGMFVDPIRFGTVDRYYFAPLDVESTVALEQVLAHNELDDDEMIIVAEVHGGHHIGFATEQLAYHHVAQGTINGEPWMVSF